MKLGDVALPKTGIRDAVETAEFGETDGVWVLDFLWQDIPRPIYVQRPGYAAVSAAWLDHPAEFGWRLRRFLAPAPGEPHAGSALAHPGTSGPGWCSVMGKGSRLTRDADGV